MSEPQGKIRVAEIFYSLQGEGLYQGTPSIFLRVFGCNFRCQGFGMPKGQLSNEYMNIDPDQWTSFMPGTQEKKYQKYEDLPLVHTGCDSYASWDHRFKHLSPWMSIDEICAKIAKLLPNGKFGDDVHLIITGGEPLLPGWQREYSELLYKMRDEYHLFDHYLDLTFETNGTQAIIQDDGVFEETLYETTITTFSVSSKLPSSGEPWEKAINPAAVKTYPGQSYFKWVVSNPEDEADVKRAICEYDIWGVRCPVYIMPAGGTTKGYEANRKWVAEMCLKNGWRYSPRLQVDLFNNAWGT